MEDFNDLYYFAAVVRHHGFSAAARAIGVDKTRLSRRVADLERRLGVRLLQRSTRSLALTEAGERFHAHCAAAVAGAEAAYASIAELQNEPRGTVRISCPVVLAQSFLAPVLPAYLARHPKVGVVVDASDRPVDLIEERYDLVLRIAARIEETAGLVARTLGEAARILVASPDYLGRNAPPVSPDALPAHATLGRQADLRDGMLQWELSGPAGQRGVVRCTPRLLCGDLRMQFEAAAGGVGIALLPAPIVASALAAGTLVHVLPGWNAGTNIVHLLYPSPRGMLPSVRSLIDYLITALPPVISAAANAASTR